MSIVMIRKAKQSDCLDLAALSLQVWLNTYATEGLRLKVSHYALSTFTESHFNDLLEKPQCEIYVYIINEHLVGYIELDLEATYKVKEYGYEVATLYVSSHFHGKGIGRALLEEVKIKHGLSMWLSTWVENYPAIKFYNKLGFEIIGSLNFDLEGELYENHVLAFGQ